MTLENLNDFDHKFWFDNYLVSVNIVGIFKFIGTYIEMQTNQKLDCKLWNKVNVMEQVTTNVDYLWEVIIYSSKATLTFLDLFLIVVFQSNPLSKIVTSLAPKDWGSSSVGIKDKWRKGEEKKRKKEKKETEKKEKEKEKEKKRKEKKKEKNKEEKKAKEKR